MKLILPYILLILIVYGGFVLHGFYLQKTNLKLSGKNVPLRQVSGFIILFILLFGSLLYFYKGAPGLEDFPNHAQSDNPDIAAIENLSDDERAAMIEQMVSNLADKQKADPDNLEGWLRLARAYGVLGEFSKQTATLRQAIRLAPEQLEIQIAFSRAIRAENHGVDNQESLALLQEILIIDGKNIEALWFIALDDWRQGRTKLAKQKFVELLNLLPQDSDERNQLENYINNVIQ